MGKQHEQEDKVNVRQWIVKESGHAPTKGSHQLWHVVEVSRHPPPPGGEQQARLFLSVGGEVGGTNDIWLSSPDGALPTRVPHLFSET